MSMTMPIGVRDLNRRRRSRCDAAPSPLARARRSALWVSVALLLGPALASAATLPAGFAETLVAGGLRRPTAMATAPDGRIFVCEQDGRLRVIRDGALLTAPFVTVATNSAGERGLLGVALDPDFASNGYVYVYYTATTPNIHNRVSRFTASGDVAAGGELIILDLEPLSAATNHNGGAIHFSSDGTLLIAVGDNANRNNSQTLTNRLGKMLRITRDGGIPSDNPFFTTATGPNRAIWALGLRNPFAFAARNGAVLINDVGENTWEEVNRGLAGANYGWPFTEGPSTDSRFLAPLYAYDHSNGNCAITGGAIYDPPLRQFPSEYMGSYFFADFCGGWIRRLDVGTGTATTFATGIALPVDLHVADNGSLYYLARGLGDAAGVVVRIDSPRPPSVSITANGVGGSIMLTAQDSLTISMAFDAGSAGVYSPAELYIGVGTWFGVFWLDAATQQFSIVAKPVFTVPLPSFGPVPVFHFPTLAGASGSNFLWVVAVDRDSNGVLNGSLVDLVATIIQ